MRESHLEALFELVVQGSSSEDNIAKRRKLEGKIDEDGEYADAEKALRDFFAKSDSKTKLQLIVEILLEGFWNQDVREKIMKKFN